MKMTPRRTSTSLTHCTAYYLAHKIQYIVFLYFTCNHQEMEMLAVTNMKNPGKNDSKLFCYCLLLLVLLLLFLMMIMLMLLLLFVDGHIIKSKGQFEM